ncbi:hypothetical protein Csa_023775, partial [Cucumis sativus]
TGQVCHNKRDVEKEKNTKEKFTADSLHHLHPSLSFSVSMSKNGRWVEALI